MLILMQFFTYRTYGKLKIKTFAIRPIICSQISIDFHRQNDVFYGQIFLLHTVRKLNCFRIMGLFTLAFDANFNLKLSVVFEKNEIHLPFEYTET